ncbi:MAG TPA: hypothetical protein VF696_01925 [Candidatus Paceibacterota bacterium]|jgi:branched-subunit amino acid permease
MALILGFLNNVLIPILFVVGALGTLAAVIAFISEAVSKSSKPWKYLLWVVLFWVVVVGGWGLINILYGAVAL